MKRRKRTIRVPINILLVLSGLCLLVCQNQEMNVSSMAERMAVPGLVRAAKGDSMTIEKWIEERALTFFSLRGYLESEKHITSYTEDETTYQMILAMQANDEYTDKEVVEEVPRQKVEVSLDKLKNYEYLLSHFYTVDSTTYADKSLLNAEEMLSKTMKISKETEGPKVLIFHTHSQEAFQDSKKGDTSTTIVGMGAYLAKKLNDKGVETMHHDGVYDLINGKLDRSKAYELSETGVRNLLKKYPSIEVVIDLHRDGVAESTHLVTDINGKKTAKIMFFNGLSRTKANGEISYLKNPYRKDNLAFSFQMQLACEKKYPGFARHIYLKGYRYSLHMKPKSLLIEAGAQNNTVEEMKNAMDLLADVLADVLS